MGGEFTADERKVALKNRLYSLLCEREEEGNWEQFLDNILLSLVDPLGEKNDALCYNLLVSKLSTCKYLSYKYFRKTLFECMNLIDRMDVYELL